MVIEDQIHLNYREVLAVAIAYSLDVYTVKETVPAVTRTCLHSDGSLPSISTKFPRDGKKIRPTDISFGEKFCGGVTTD